MSPITFPTVSATLNLSPLKKVNKGTRTANGYKINIQSLFQLLPYFRVTNKVGIPTMKKTRIGARIELTDLDKTSSKSYFERSKTL